MRKVTDSAKKSIQFSLLWFLSRMDQVPLPSMTNLKEIAELNKI